ncbi:MAG: hypothetical protein ACOYMY_12420 [Prochlorococcaceae cyanobacterium]
MRFYAVSTAAIDHTHRALSRLHQQDRSGHRPSRALRVAQLYGHLQCRADDSGALRLALRELAAAWHLQPNILRADLQDLQRLGWLRYEGRPDGTHIRLIDHDGTTATRPQPDLLAVFVEEYNRHRPPSWPAYAPRSSGLTGRLTRAIRHAGGADAFWAVLRQALTAMPPFWRDTYPNGRSGGDCVAALLSTDRQGAGLGVEFWHVFRWAAAGNGSSTPTSTTPTASTASTTGEQLLATARSLFLWDGHHWRGQGSAALRLERSERLRLTLALEAAGVGQPGAALAQFGPADA